MQLTKWMVRQQFVAGCELYQVYRIVFADPYHDSIQTHGGLWKHKKEAEQLCGRLNRIERGFRDEVTP